MSLDKEKFSRIKIVMCDVDGTLLTDSGTVSVRTIEAIKKLREKGLLFGVCTGRDLTAVKNSLELWGVKGLIDVIVGTGGSEICDFTKNFEEGAFPLEGELIKEVINHFEDMDVNFVIPHNGILHVPKDDRHIRLLAKKDGVPYKVVDFNEFLKEPKQKVMLMMEPETMDTVVERASTFSSDSNRSSSVKLVRSRIFL